MSSCESKFGLYQPFLNQALGFFRKGRLDEAEECLGQIREIIADSQHPEDLGFLHYLEFYRAFCAQDYSPALLSLDQAELHFDTLNSSSRSVLIRHY
ncbi:MAG: hypothetical protein LHW56_01190, partial [Candidatus Cloacimonetes bacterium]|nr:hypothetical protein [Candidatus Cloacimonadota bacterium]MDY0171500.1 hypothetical protein [Candidatus Cloacimonadaceae bacterium]